MEKGIILVLVTELIVLALSLTFSNNAQAFLVLEPVYPDVWKSSTHKATIVVTAQHFILTSAHQPILHRNVKNTPWNNRISPEMSNTTCPLIVSFVISKLIAFYIFLHVTLSSTSCMSVFHPMRYHPGVRQGLSLFSLAVTAGWKANSLLSPAFPAHKTCTVMTASWSSAPSQQVPHAAGPEVTAG